MTSPGTDRIGLALLVATFLVSMPAALIGLVFLPHYGKIFETWVNQSVRVRDILYADLFLVALLGPFLCLIAWFLNMFLLVRRHFPLWPKILSSLAVAACTWCTFKMFLAMH